MRPFLLRVAAVTGVCAVLLAVGAAQAQVPLDALKACKTEVGARYLNIPMAYISVDHGSTAANGNYLVNWTATVPGGKRSNGFCVLDPNLAVLRFEITGGPGPGSGRLPPENAMRVCKAEVERRLHTVPMSYITAQLGTQGVDGSYMINWQAQPPMAGQQSGFCDVAPNGKVRNFQFDRSSQGKPGN
jgi:uncharacterized protein (UPF0212 family)